MIAASYACTWLAMALYVVALARGGRQFERAASAAAGAGWILLTAALIARGATAGHWPLTNRYEFALCFVWSILGAYLVLEILWRERRAGAFAMAAALLVATFAMLRPQEEKMIRPLLPALRSVWLQLHVVAAAIGYGAYAVGAALAAARLAECRIDGLDRQTQRMIDWAFPWLSLALLTGAIWAQDAWGRYWGWDPKESWTLIIWLWCLLLLHVRGLPGWRGRRYAWLTLAGFGIICFAFAALPWLLRTVRMTTLHGF